MVLMKIKRLNVRDCKNLVSLGEKEDDEDNIGSNLLSSLRNLYVSGCKSMEHCSLNGESIEALTIWDCESLTCVSFIGGEGQNLKSLSIGGCEKLMAEKINNASMPMLEHVSIFGWRNLKSLIQLSNSIHLTNMRIYDCPSIESFPPDIQLPNLTRLAIGGCENLKSFPVTQLPNLIRLIIESCQNLTSFPDIQLPNLTSLRVRSCQNLESFPELQLMNLNLLTDMEILDCPSIDAKGHWPPNLVTLVIGRLKKPISECGFQNFPTSLVDLSLWNEADVINFSHLSHLLPSSLKELRIVEFNKLKSLSVGLQHLTSLQHLHIENCPKMKHLPETLLPSLLSLKVSDCRILS